MTDKTGNGALVFATEPTLVNPVVGTQSPGDNSTKAASTAYVDAVAAKVQTLSWDLNLSSMSSNERTLISSCAFAGNLSGINLRQIGGSSLTYTFKKNGASIGTIGPLSGTTVGTLSVSTAFSISDIFSYIITGTFTGAIDHAVSIAYTRTLA